MAYKNGTYIAFHANDTPNPTESDIKYYNTMKMWNVRDDDDFSFVNSHEKTSSVRDTSKKETLRRALVERLNNSKNMVLIIGETTRFDTDWVPFEIEHAIDQCSLPIIATYPMYDVITAPALLASLWPTALSERINNGTAHVIHIPFKKEPLADALSQFSIGKYPTGGGLAYYSREAYANWGLII